MNPISMRRALIGALLTAALWCAATAGAAQSKIVYEYWPFANADTVIPTLVADFEKAHPDITVELTKLTPGENGDVYAHLLAQIASGTAPDVAGFERSAIIGWAAAGALQALDPQMERGISADYLPGAASEVFYDGKAYGVPFGTDIRGLYWNTDLLAAGGYDPQQGPASMADLDAMAAKLTRTQADGKFSQLGFVPWFGNWYAVGWLYTFGRDIFNTTTHRPVVNSENDVRGFEWIKEYAERYPPKALAASGFNDNSFQNGNLAMMASYSGYGLRLRQGNPALNFTAGEVPHPDYGSNGSWMGGYANVIPAGTAYSEATRTFLQWLSSKETEIAYYKLTNGLPTRRDALQAVGRELPPVVSILVRQAGVAHGRPPLWYPQIYNGTLDAMNKVIALQAPPSTALDEAQKLLDQEFAKVFGQ